MSLENHPDDMSMSKKIIIALLIATVYYFACCFCGESLNPIEWHRAIKLIATIVAVWLIILAVAMFKK